MGIEQERGKAPTAEVPPPGGSILAGRRALVVGGSGGIGRGVARALAARGAELLLLGGRDGKKLEALLGECADMGGRASGRLLDLEDEGLFDLDSLETMLGPHLRFDILVCAFGPFLQRPLAETSPADWRRLSLLNLALPGAFASLILPGMIEGGWGRMVFFGGTGTDTIKASKTNAAYAAAKTGLGVLSKSIALQHSGDGVASFVVCPGLVDTEYLAPEAKATLAALSPGGRLLDPLDFGETLVALAAAEPCLVSGAVLAMDAGLAFARGA